MASSSPDGVREDEFIIPAVPSNDDFESDPEVGRRCGLDESSKSPRVERRKKEKFFFVDWRRCRSPSPSTTSSPPRHLAPAAPASLVMESVFSVCECFFMIMHLISRLESKVNKTPVMR